MFLAVIRDGNSNNALSQIMHAIEIVRSQDCMNLVGNLEIGTQFLDSKTVQCNLKFVQIPRLHGVYIYIYIYSV